METTKVTLTFVKSTPKTSSGGKNYISVSIKAKEYGDKFLSGFGNKDNQNWKVGDTVEIFVKQVLKDGKEYLNFETPKKENELASIKHDIELLKTAMGHMKFIVERLKEKVEGSDLDDYPLDNIDADKIPF